MSHGSASKTVRRIRQSGIFRVAYIDEYPWAIREPDGSMGGLDGEILKACSEQIALPAPHFEEVLLNGVEEAMETQRYDLITCGLGWSQRRAELAEPSVPLYRARLAMFVKKGNPLGIRTMSQVAASSYQVGTIGQGLEEYTLRPHVGQRAQIYSEQTSMWADLEVGRIAAAYFERLAGLGYLKRHENAGFEVADPFEDPTAPLFKTALWFRRGDDLRVAFDGCLNRLKASGELGLMLSRYGSGSDDILPVGSSFDP